MTDEQLRRLAQIANRPTEATLGEIESMATALVVINTHSRVSFDYMKHLKLEPYSKKR